MSRCPTNWSAAAEGTATTACRIIIRESDRPPLTLPSARPDADPPWPTGGRADSRGILGGTAAVRVCRPLFRLRSGAQPALPDVPLDGAGNHEQRTGR